MTHESQLEQIADGLTSMPPYEPAGHAIRIYTDPTDPTAYDTLQVYDSAFRTCQPFVRLQGQIWAGAEAVLMELAFVVGSPTAIAALRRLHAGGLIINGHEATPEQHQLLPAKVTVTPEQTVMLGWVGVTTTGRLTVVEGQISLYAFEPPAECRSLLGSGGHAASRFQLTPYRLFGVAHGPSQLCRESSRGSDSVVGLGNGQSAQDQSPT